MRTTHLATLAAVAFVGLAVAIADSACSTSSTDSASCDSICGAVANCGGSTCLATCVNTQLVCEKANRSAASSAFDDWIACQPALACTATGYSDGHCVAEYVGILTSCGEGAALGAGGTGTGTGDSGVIVLPHDAGHDVVVVTGPDRSTGTDATGDGFTGGDACVSDGSCDTSCLDNCGNTCTGGSCPTSCVPDGSCDTSCLDNCGNTCTGGSCPTCTPNGSCSASCLDNCGNACTGGSCPSCVSTGCGNCTTACGLAEACNDNCGNPCCS